MSSMHTLPTAQREPRQLLWWAPQNGFRNFSLNWFRELLGLYELPAFGAKMCLISRIHNCESFEAHVTRLGPGMGWCGVDVEWILFQVGPDKCVQMLNHFVPIDVKMNLFDRNIPMCQSRVVGRVQTLGREEADSISITPSITHTWSNTGDKVAQTSNQENSKYKWNNYDIWIDAWYMIISKTQIVALLPKKY